MKLHLGAGGNILSGWQNHDRDLDLEKLPLPFSDNSADRIFSEHCFEHFPPGHVLCLMRECLRILKPGGTLRLCMPVLDRLTPAHAADIIQGHGHRAVFSTVLICQFLMAAGFHPSRIEWVDFDDTTDGHWKVISREKDELETARIEATK